MTLPPNVDHWPEFWRGEYEERICIVKDGCGIEEWEARVLAEADTRRRASKVGQQQLLPENA